MDQYGEFIDMLNSLRDALEEVRISWYDRTAATYDSINENTGRFCAAAWTYYSYVLNGYEAVKTNYNEAEFESNLKQLGNKIMSV